MARKFSYKTNNGNDSSYIELKRFYLCLGLFRGFLGLKQLPLLQDAIVKHLTPSEIVTLTRLVKEIPEAWRPRSQDYFCYFETSPTASPISSAGFKSTLKAIDNLTLLMPLFKEYHDLFSPYITTSIIGQTTPSEVFCVEFYKMAEFFLSANPLFDKHYQRHEIFELSTNSNSFTAKIVYVKDTSTGASLAGKAGFLASSGRLVKKIHQAKLFTSIEEMNGDLKAYNIKSEHINIIEANLDIKGLDLKVDSSDNDDMVKAEKIWLTNSLEASSLEKEENAAPKARPSPTLGASINKIKV